MNPKVSELLNDAHKGSLVVPDFQRSFVWEPDAVRELLVSVLGSYFIGSILILQQFKEDSMFALRMIEGANEVNPSAQIQPFVKVLLDGQQRITALYYAIYAPNIPMKNRGSAYRFYLDLNEGIKGEWDNAVKAVNIKDKKGMNEISKKERAIAFSSLLNFGAIIDRFKMDPEFKQIYAIVTGFMDREIYAIELDKDTPSERIVETFERINRTGKPLTAFELLTARLYKSGIKLRELLSQAKEDYRFLESVEPDFIPKVIAIFRGKEPKRKLVLELDPVNFVEDWERSCDALEDAYTRMLDLKNGYGAFDFKRWVPYSTMVVPLACMIDLFKANKLESKSNYDKIDQWYWTSVFTNRYDQAADSSSFADFTAVKSWVNGGKTPDFIANFDPIALDWNIEKQSSAIYRGVLNLVVLNGALDFKTGQAPQLDSKHVQDDHIFPKSVYKVNVFPNRTLLTKNLEKWDKIPSDYFKELEQLHGHGQLIEILKTHLIPSEALDVLLADNLQEFIRLRAFAIINELRRRLSLVLIQANDFVLENKQRISDAAQVSSEQQEQEFDEDQDATQRKGHKSWLERLGWSTKTGLAEKFIQSVSQALPSSAGRPQGPWYRVYTKQPMTAENQFLVIVLNKNSVRICLRAEEGTLNDPEKITHPVKGWFFDVGGEQRFQLTDDNIEYCLGLARQSYEKLTSGI